MNAENRAQPDELGARGGELRRLTFMYCDVVDSTELSGRLEPETYRELMRGYRNACRDVIETQYDGHIMMLKGDGTLSTFGFPFAHENDAERAVRAGLALVQTVRGLSNVTASSTGESLDVRVGVHHGPVYLDVDEDDIYGLAANVGARLQTIADPGTVFISDEVRQLVEDQFEIEAREPQTVKGVAEPLTPFQVISERATPLERPWTAPLVEREAELERLRALWAPVTAGTTDRSTGVLVRGDAGVGKSRLVASLVEEVRAGDGHIVELRGSPFHVDAGFHPVRNLLEARCGIKDDTDPVERLEKLTRQLREVGLDPSDTVRFLTPILGIDPSAGYDAATTEGRKLEQQVSQAVFDYVIACHGAQPGIILAEDLHWFDEASRALMDDLSRSGPPTLLVVATSREDERGRWETIELHPLSQNGRLALIDAFGKDLSKNDRLDLAKRSDGIPLYIEELVRAEGLRTVARPDTHVPVPGSVPEVLYEPLVARLYVTPSALPVAATVAAAGSEVERVLLSATTSITCEELDSTLRALVDARVLDSIEGPPKGYRFRHELLREVAYELQPPSWRRNLHDRLCDFLTRDEPSDWTVIAMHYERAERHSEAAGAYEKAADWARRRGAIDEARAHLTRAIDLLGQVTQDAARDHLEVELRLRRGYMAMTTDGFASPEAADDFGRCLELAAADPQGDDAFSTSISVWAYDLCRAELGRARRASETMRAGLGGKRDYFRPQNIAAFGMLDWFEGKFTEAATELTKATDELDALGREDEVMGVWFVPSHPTAAMHTHLALARFMVGDTAGAVESLARVRTVTAGLDFPQGPWSADYGRWLGSWMWIESGRLELADAALAELRSSSSRHGFDSWELVAATQTAALEAAKVLGTESVDAAVLREHAEELGNHVDVWQMLGLRVLLTFYMTTTGALLAASGDVDGARRRYEESLQLSAETGMRFYDAETARRMAHLSSEREEVVAQLRAALDFARSQGAHPFELRIAHDIDRLSQ